VKPVSRVAYLALLVAVTAALAALLAGPGYRLAWWSLGTGFTVLRWAAWGAAAAAAIAVVAALLARPDGPRRGFAVALAALAIGVATFAWPTVLFLRAKSAPPIHDVTTDTENPPRFVGALSARAGASNPADYGGAEIAVQQRRAYPAIVPFDSSLPPPAMFDRSLSVVRAMGWQVLSTERDEGRIEATDTTPFFGFADDIVIRIVPRGTGSRVDVRSVSRVGKSDLGTNARRVGEFLDRLRSGA